MRGAIGFVSFLLVEMSTLFVLLPYLYVAVRRAYALRRPAALAAMLAIGAALLPVILVYRLILFWVTFLSL